MSTETHALGTQRSQGIIPSHSSVPESSLTTHVVEHESDFDLLEKPWSALAAAARAHPFQQFGWVQAWIRTIGRAQRRPLRIATAWQQSQLVAALPLVERRYLGARVLEWLGLRGSDYCDALIDPSFDATSVIMVLWRALEARGDCDVIRLGQARTDAQIAPLFKVAQLHPWLEKSEQACYVPIRWSNSADWLSQRGARARKSTRQHLRRLADAGYEFHLWQPPDPYEPLFEALLAQKMAWMAAKGRGLLFEHSEGPQFLRACVAAMAKAGTLHLSALRSSKGFAACHLGFYQNDVLYAHMLSYDLDCLRYSPGTAICDAVMMWACDHGVRGVDLLRGDEAYKFQYQPELRSSQTWIIPLSAVGRVCLTAYRLKHYARTRHH